MDATAAMRSLLDEKRAQRDSVKEEHRAFLTELRAVEASLCLLERQCAELEAAMALGEPVATAEKSPLLAPQLRQRERALPGERAAPLLELLRLRGGSWASPAEIRLASGMESVTVTNALTYLLGKGMAERLAVPGSFDKFGHQRYEYRAVAAALEVAE